MRRPSPPAPWALAPPPPAFQRHAPQKPPPSGSPARPRGLPDGGGARQAAQARMQESRIAAHSRTRLALEELSQSLSLKVLTEYHGQTFRLRQPSKMLQ